MNNHIRLICFVLVIISFSVANHAQDKPNLTGKAPLSANNTTIHKIKIADGPGTQCRYAYYYDVNTSMIGRLSWDGGCAGGDLASWTPPVFASGGVEGGNGNFYILDGTSSKLCQFDTSNGNVTILGQITGTGSVPTNGIAYNSVNDTYYLCGFSGSENYLYTLDINTLTASVVSSMSSSSPMIAIAINSSGVGYGYEASPDNEAYSFDPVTGAFTLLGPIGFNAQYGQDMDIEIETGIIYLAAYNLDTGAGELREMDPYTGLTSVLYTFGDQISVFEFDNLYGVTPVELTSFTGKVENGNVILNWATSTETNNDGFEVQRSGGGSQRSETGDQNGWDNIGFVKGNGTTTEQKIYSFADENLTAGKYKYRLKQIDYDGSYKYSNEIEVKISLPEEFSLSQNFPNPFNPTTTINYTIPEVISNPAGRERNLFVTLKVYNVLGKEVATLVNEEKQPGVYSVEFDSYSDEGQNLSSGVYYYTISAGNYNQSKKMILLK